MRFLRGLGSTYLHLLRRLGSVLAVLLLSAAASVIVVYPLWVFATRSRRAYTVTVLSALGVGLVTMIVTRLVNRVRTDRSYLSRRLLPAVRTAGFVYFACSKNGADAIQANREKLAFLFRNKHQDENIATVDKSIDHAAIMELVKKRDIPGAARLVPEEAVQQFSVAGTPAECRRGLQAYIDAGVDEPIIEVSGTAEEKALALDVIRDFTGGGAS